MNNKYFKLTAKLYYHFNITPGVNLTFGLLDADGAFLLVTLATLLAHHCLPVVFGTGGFILVLLNNQPCQLL